MVIGDSEGEGLKDLTLQLLLTVYKEEDGFSLEKIQLKPINTSVDVGGIHPIFQDDPDSY